LGFLGGIIVVVLDWVWLVVSPHTWLITKPDEYPLIMDGDF
jgi:hypothetical protein